MKRTRLVSGSYFGLALGYMIHFGSMPATIYPSSGELGLIPVGLTGLVSLVIALCSLID